MSESERMKILVCVDLSDATEVIMQSTEKLAKQTSAKVRLLHNALPEPDKVEFKVDPIAAREELAKRFHAEHRQVQGLAQRLRDAGIESNSLLVHGETVESILREADDFDSDMIILGSHGKGRMFQLLLGSISEGVLHKSEIPVLVIPTR